MNDRSMTPLFLMASLLAGSLLSGACDSPDDAWDGEDYELELEDREYNDPKFDLGGIDPTTEGPSLPTCPAPFPYTNDPCFDNCVPGNVGEIICDFSGSLGSTQAVSVWAATDLHGSASPNYQVWGLDEDGQQFCCDFEQGLRNLRITGTSHDDQLRLDWGAGGIVLDNHPGDATHLEVTVEGTLGDDVMLGSPVGNSMYEEHFYGGADDDIIALQGGHDYAYGGAGSDTIDGGPGDDYIEGGIGEDWIDGGHGADELRGDGGNDHIGGGPGGDTIYGGDQDDALCSGTDDPGAPDTVISGPGNDEVWVPAGNQTPTLGVTASDTCGDVAHQAAGPGCSWTLAGPPAC